jgi:hypothetical protein
MGSFRLFAVVVGVVGLLAIPAGPAGGQSAAFTVVADNLDNPRGLAFGPGGALFVAEAGRGGSGPPCATIPPPPPDFQVCYGPSGAVTRILGAEQERVVEGLPSLAAPVPGGTGVEVYAGPHDVSFAGERGFLVTGLGFHPDVRSNELVPVGGLFGQLWRFWPGLTRVADISAFELTNPDGSVVHSNPYAVLATPDAQYVVDAGGNSLLRVVGGEVTLVAVFPARPTPPGGPPGPPVFESVPDSIALGPGGDLFVGELTGFPFPVGAANVYRVSPGGDVDVYASGFTNIIDVAFDEGGNLYVLEFATNGLLSGDPTGALWRVTPQGTKAKIEIEGLTLVSPAGLAIGGGAIYISNRSTSAGEGEVVRIPLTEDEQEEPDGGVGDEEVEDDVDEDGPQEADDVDEE